MVAKLDKLSELAAEVGLDLTAIEFTDFYECTVKYLNPKRAGIMPVADFCRDQLDYKLRMTAWILAGTEYSPKYPDFDSLLAGEIKRLKRMNHVS